MEYIDYDDNQQNWQQMQSDDEQYCVESKISFYTISKEEYEKFNKFQMEFEF